MTSSSAPQIMLDINKIVHEVERRHDRKELRDAFRMRFKDFGIVILLLTFAFSPLISLLLIKLVNLII